MKKFYETLKQNGDVVFGRFVSNPDLCLAKGAKNSIFFSAINAAFRGFLEIDGKDFTIISENLYKIEVEGMEIFLTSSGKDRGEFTAGILGLSLLDDEMAEKTCEQMISMILNK